MKAKKALPLVDILTLAATGSEYDAGCVISRTETNDKIGYIDELLFPVASILDPTYTFSVSKNKPQRERLMQLTMSSNNISVKKLLS